MFIPAAWLLPRWFIARCENIIFTAIDSWCDSWESEDGPIPAREGTMTAPGGTVGPPAGS